jgi:hypothetical protein
MRRAAVTGRLADEIAARTADGLRTGTFVLAGLTPRRLRMA